MNKIPIGSLALVVSLVFSSTSALADGLQGGANGGFKGVPGAAGPFVPRLFVPQPVATHPLVPQLVIPHPFMGQPLAPNPFTLRPFVHRSFIPFGAPGVVYVSPPVYYGSASLYTPPDVYDPPVDYSQPMTAVSVAPAPAPMPDPIEYPTGRYELRGDGMTAPYTWVWIPNPPPPPPTAPPAAVTPEPPPARDDPSPAPPHQLYRWTDGQGVVHWTDNPDSIPEPQRAQAKRISSH